MSLEAQEAKLNAYAELYELELVGIEVDAGVSAKSLNRPALQRALSRLMEGTAEGLLVVKLDRLTRSVRDLGELIERYFMSGRWSLMSVSEQVDTRTASGRMVLNVLGVISQWEREVIGERTRDAMQHLKAQGKRYCHAVFGEGPGEAATLAWMQAERKAGRSYEAIADLLNAAGVPTSVSGRWQGNTVRRILLRVAPRKERRVA